MGEKETATAVEAERLKTKTKSNQSNDRSGVTDDDWQDDDTDDDDSAEARINNTKSNVKNVADEGAAERRSGPRDAVQGFRTATADDDPSGPDTEGLRKLELKDAENMDDMASSQKLAPERPVKSEIATSEPGTAANLAVSDDGGPQTPKKIS